MLININNQILLKIIRIFLKKIEKLKLYIVKFKKNNIIIVKINLFNYKIKKIKLISIIRIIYNKYIFLHFKNLI